MSTRRDLLAALVALAAAPSIVSAAPAVLSPDLDPEAVRRIGAAWLKNHPWATAKALAAELFPEGHGLDALAGLRAAAAADFRSGAVFNHRGWRLSNTEGALFALICLKA
jgi:predicted MFS family arabinose efflux permease